MSSDPAGSDNYEIMQRVAARAIDDEGFRDQLARYPKAELAKIGLTLPDGVQVEVLENTQQRLHLVLPSRQEPQGELDPDKRKGFHLLNRWPV